jgi:hypothetical protein
MSKGQPLAAETASIAPLAGDGADAPDPSVLLAEEHLRVLAELREIGMEMTRILKRRAEIDLQSAETLAGHAKSDEAYLAPPPLPGPMRDPATAFARMSRAVRLTLALEARTAEAIRALRADLPLQRENRQREMVQAEAAEGAAAANTARRPEASEAPADLLADDTQDSDEFKAADVARAERLSEHEARESLAGRPLRKVVESLCADLRLAADTSPWSGEVFAAQKARLTQLSTAADVNGARLIPTLVPQLLPRSVQWPRTPPPVPPPPSAAPPTRGRTGPGSHC